MGSSMEVYTHSMAQLILMSPDEVDDVPVRCGEDGSELSSIGETVHCGGGDEYLDIALTDWDLKKGDFTRMNCAWDPETEQYVWSKLGPRY